MPVQTRSHGRPAQSLTTKIREAITPTPRKTAAPKKTAVKKTDGARVTKKSGTTKHKRKTGIADKIEGVALKIEGALTGKPAVKAAGTKKIRGTDGKGSTSSTPAKKVKHTAV
ncbi:hypothetical protein DFH27DRAFT_520963 [Peziza echinospora]|nr:hypothetical protein DFH27DRAFT_520963 [Peziza echinospora]